MWPLHFPHVTRPWSRYTCFFVSARLCPERRFSPRRSWTLSKVSFETIGGQFASTTRYRWLSGSLDWSSGRFFLLTSVGVQWELRPALALGEERIKAPPLGQNARLRGGVKIARPLRERDRMAPVSRSTAPRQFPLRPYRSRRLAR